MIIDFDKKPKRISLACTVIISIAIVALVFGIAVGFVLSNDTRQKKDLHNNEIEWISTFASEAIRYSYYDIQNTNQNNEADEQKQFVASIMKRLFEIQYMIPDVSVDFAVYNAGGEVICSVGDNLESVNEQYNNYSNNESLTSSVSRIDEGWGRYTMVAYRCMQIVEGEEFTLVAMMHYDFFKNNIIYLIKMIVICIIVSVLTGFVIGKIVYSKVSASYEYEEYLEGIAKELSDEVKKIVTIEVEK